MYAKPVATMHAVAVVSSPVAVMVLGIGAILRDPRLPSIPTPWGTATRAC